MLSHSAGDLAGILHIQKHLNLASLSDDLPFVRTTAGPSQKQG